MPQSLIITESIPSFHKKVLYAIRDELNIILPPIAPKIEIAIKNRTDQFFWNTSEAQALINGPLDKHFGIPSGEAKIKVGAIIRTIANNIEVSFKRLNVYSGQLRGGFSAGVLVSDFSDVLSNPEATVLTVNGQQLPWLQWLLIEGDRIIITDYEIAFGRYTQSRSGGAIMKRASGGIWRVPSQYSGTVRNNWLTRAILNASSAYIDMVADVMFHEISKAL